jgi:hypothetical protein
MSIAIMTKAVAPRSIQPRDRIHVITAPLPAVYVDCHYDQSGRAREAVYVCAAYVWWDSLDTPCSQ